MYGYSKRIVRGLCHVIVDGKVKRPGEVAGNPINSPILITIMPGVIPGLDLPKPQLGLTSAEHDH
jgi:hypothetical protein